MKTKKRRVVKLKQKTFLTLLTISILALTGFLLISNQPPLSNLNPIALGFIRNPTTQKSNLPNILLITSPANNYFDDWQSVLQKKGFTVTQVYLETLVNNPTIADVFDILILDTSCTSINQSASEIIAGTGKPVLTVGSAGYIFLNHLGAQITPREVVNKTEVHVLSISTKYNNWDVHYHIVYQYPQYVNYNISLLYGEITQRYILLPLSEDNLTLTNSPKLIPLAKDLTQYDDYFLSIYNQYESNPHLLHWALHNITTISQSPYGNSLMQTLTNTLIWLHSKNPYSVQILPNLYKYNASETVNISISAISNFNLTRYGGITLNITVVDDSQNIAHTDQLVTSSTGPVYTSFQIPQISGLSYTINATDGQIFSIEPFTVQPTDYRITEFTANPSTIYLGEGGVLLNSCVTVEGNAASNILVRWSVLNKLEYPNASFTSNPDLYTLVGYVFTNSSGYAASQWFPQKMGVYEVVAWIRDYNGLPKNWTSTQVTVKMKAGLSVNLTGIGGGLIYVGDTVTVEGQLTLNYQPPQEVVSINVTIYDPNSHPVSHIIYTSSSGQFFLNWTPSLRGIYTIFCTYAGNITVDSVTRGLEFAVHLLMPGLETDAKNGQVVLGSTLQITANFSKLSFTPQPQDPVTLMVIDLAGKLVYSEEYRMNNTEYFQAQWTPQSLGEYTVLLLFNQTYTVVSTSKTISVVTQGEDYNSEPQALLGLSLGSSNQNGSNTTPIVLAMSGFGFVGSAILFTRLRKSREIIYKNFEGDLYGPSETGEGQEDED